MSETANGSMQALASALVEAQKEMPSVDRDKNVTVKTEKGSFAYSYTTLGHLIATTKDVLSKHGLAIVQSAELHDEGKLFLRTRILHESGEILDAGAVPLIGAGTMQNLGSALTYARRYSWAAALGIADEEDDDGQSLAAPKKARRTKAEGEPQASAILADPAGVSQVTKEPASPSVALPDGWRNEDEQKKWLKKAHYLVGTMREKAYVTTEQVWRLAGYDPGMDDVRDDGELHWRDLHPLLTKQEASALIDQLERIEQFHGLAIELLASLPVGKREEARLRVEDNRAAHAQDPDAHLAWLREQVARAGGAS